MTIEPFLLAIPEAFKKDPEVVEWARQIHLRLDNLYRPEGVLAESEETGETVVTQQGQIDALETQADATDARLDSLLDSSPTYTITNDGTVRSLNADDAAGTISAVYSQAEIENLRDAILVQGDVQATVIRDLKNKGILGT